MLKEMLRAYCMSIQEAIDYQREQIDYTYGEYWKGKVEGQIDAMEIILGKLRYMIGEQEKETDRELP